MTERETEIIVAIAKGLSNREIADLFGIAETTVKTHTSRIYGKLGVKRRGQAVVRARELQLIE
ncbi:response regulator transcription factor [Paenibacillus sp. BIC5C1]|uniref:response regulator transcription factor n=1 Tax=Paenibacillus sp. BIC5C1 TaxID=3078263 RepID=UPI0037CA8895